MKTLLLTLTTCLFVLPANAQYSGGTGEPNDPYQIATAADLIALGETPEDYGKSFILIADIDLDPNLPGRKVFDKAVIAPPASLDQWGNFWGTAFAGVLDGKGHKISHLTIMGGSYLGLFGCLNYEGEVKDLAIMDVNVTGSDWCVGGLVGYSNYGSVTRCCTTGVVSGKGRVGGLVGDNWGYVNHCYSAGVVSGTGYGVGGLLGGNSCGSVTHCYSTATVRGEDIVGGLIGNNGNYHGCFGKVTHCYSTGATSGIRAVGGLVGGLNARYTTVIACFWDTQTSGQVTSGGGTGKTTAEMQTRSTFVTWGACGPFWTIDDGRDYPHLAWENVPGDVIPGPIYGGGAGTMEDPYLIYTADQLNAIGLAPCARCQHFKLMADINLSPFDGKEGRPAFNVIGDCYYDNHLGEMGGSCLGGIPFTGVFDGNSHTVSYLTVEVQGRCGGLFGGLGSGGQVKNLGVVDVNITLSPDPEESDDSPLTYPTGGLVGYNDGGIVTQCYSSGVVASTHWWGDVGGLVGYNRGSVTHCHSTGVVGALFCVGGLVGHNYYGSVIQSYSGAGVNGFELVGGLVGYNFSGTVSQCYSTGAVTGKEEVGGLAGCTSGGTVSQCYSTGAVTGKEEVGGLVGDSTYGDVSQCFWDTQTSGRTTSASGTGKTTAEMQTASTFLEAGWDFTGETANGAEDIWWILEGKDYPRLWWEAHN